MSRFQTLSTSIFILLAALQLFGAGPGHDHSALSKIGQGAAIAADPRSTDEAKYAPDRTVDIKHVALDVTPDFDKRNISGVVTITFTPISKPLEQLRLDGVDLTISSVTSSSPLAGYQTTKEEVVIDFAQPIAAKTESQITIRYSGHPIKGLYFRAPSNGYSADEMHLFTQGEMSDARYWFPSYDYPNEKFTSAVTCHVPKNMTVLSNGRQIGSSDEPSGLKAVHWLQDKPHTNYLITLVAGYFNKIEDKYRDIPLSFYTLSSDSAQAPLAFADTKAMMQIFEKEIGVAFPWAQYGQVVVRDFTHGGMENTSVTTLFDSILRTSDTENIQPVLGPCYSLTAEGLLAHELAHQWFGDLVTCKDWSHSWLNEGFATYYAMLYAGARYGQDTFLYFLFKDRNVILEDGRDSRPIVFHNYKAPMEQFDLPRNYQKGAWVLQMIRVQLGEDLFRKCIKTYLERHQYDTVVTADLLRVVEEFSGQSFDRFFDQWLAQSQVPEITINYNWEERSKLAKITVSQSLKAEKHYGENRRVEADKQDSQKLAAFHFPLTVRFKVNGKAVDKQFDVKSTTDSFQVALTQAPDTVTIDPALGLLAKINCSLPTPMLYAQLADQSDLVGRLMACQDLAKKHDDKTIAKLKEALNSDKFYGVRMQAADSLREIHTEGALESLIASVNQSDARVRQHVIAEIGKFFHPLAMQALVQCLQTEHNPAIIETAIGGLGSYHHQSVTDALLKYLSSDSYQQRVAVAAISTIRSLEDPHFVAPLRDVLLKREKSFTSEGFATGLDTLAYIERNEKPRDEVRDFISGYLNAKREGIQTGAIRALGTLGDPEAIAALETFASSNPELPQQHEAERAISNIRWNNKPNDNLKDMRAEVLDLQKASREQKKELERLKKTLEAVESKGKREAKPPPREVKTLAASKLQKNTAPVKAGKQ